MSEIEKKSCMFKYDLNFLEFPLWSVSERSSAINIHITKHHGTYSLFSVTGLPTLLDIMVLYYLLYKVFHCSAFQSYECRTTRYEIATNVFRRSTAASGSYAFNRIIKSLRKWALVRVEFTDLFCVGDSYTTRSFGIIDDMQLCQKKREVFIRFNPLFIQQLRNSNLHHYLDYMDYKQFKSALTTRLYELLSKKFEHADSFSLNIQHLAEKLTLSKREGCKKYYPSDVLLKLKKPLEELKKKGVLASSFVYCKTTATCCFTKALHVQ